MSRVQFERTLQQGLHDELHDTIGGFMTTPASPLDPLFMPWHSTIDMFGYLWDLCYANGNQTQPPLILYSPDSKAIFGNMSTDEELWIKMGDLDVRKDTLIGTFFANLSFAVSPPDYSYESPEYKIVYSTIPIQFQEKLLGNSTLCPYGMARLADEEILLKKAFLEQNSSFVPIPTPSINDLNSTILPRWLQDASKVGLELWATCLFDQMDLDTLERWFIDDVFNQRILPNPDFVKHPPCDYLRQVDMVPRPPTVAPTAVVQSGVRRTGFSHGQAYLVEILCILLIFLYYY